jgi:hypothetical protein
MTALRILPKRRKARKSSPSSPKAAKAALHSRTVGKSSMLRTTGDTVELPESLCMDQFERMVCRADNTPSSTCSGRDDLIETACCGSMPLLLFLESLPRPRAGFGRCGGGAFLVGGRTEAASPRLGSAIATSIRAFERGDLLSLVPFVTRILRTRSGPS